MGSRSTYRCLNCRNTFIARRGGGFCFIEYRCVNCDTIKSVKCMNRGVSLDEYWEPPNPEQIGVCPKCGGELRDDIGPMCPECKSRDIECLGTHLNYD